MRVMTKTKMTNLAAAIASLLMASSAMANPSQCTHYAALGYSNWAGFAGVAGMPGLYNGAYAGYAGYPGSPMYADVHYNGEYNNHNYDYANWAKEHQTVIRTTLTAKVDSYVVYQGDDDHLSPWVNVTFSQGYIGYLGALASKVPQGTCFSANIVFNPGKHVNFKDVSAQINMITTQLSHSMSSDLFVVTSLIQNMWPGQMMNMTSIDGQGVFGLVSPEARTNRDPASVHTTPLGQAAPVAPASVPNMASMPGVMPSQAQPGFAPQQAYAPGYYAPQQVQPSYAPPAQMAPMSADPSARRTVPVSAPAQFHFAGK